MTLVDPYHDRVFRNGRVYGVNYDERTMKPTYSDISPFGSGRMAGDGLGLDSDVVLYMGRAAQGMPQDEDMDQRIADGFMKAIDQFFKPRTMEYREERDGPLNIQPIGPYRHGDDQGLVQLLASAEHPKFRAGPYSQIGARPKGLRAIGPDALNSLPNSEIAKDKYMKIRNAISLPKF